MSEVGTGCGRPLEEQIDRRTCIALAQRQRFDDEQMFTIDGEPLAAGRDEMDGVGAGHDPLRQHRRLLDDVLAV